MYLKKGENCCKKTFISIRNLQNISQAFAHSSEYIFRSYIVLKMNRNIQKTKKKKINT